MNASTDNQDTETKPKKWVGTRKGDGGTYLVIADKSEEFPIAAHYACNLAKARRGHVAIAHITDLEEFVHWGKVETMMRKDLRKQAEQEIWTIAKDMNENHGVMPALHVQEGQVIDRIIHLINEDTSIRSLILAGSVHGNTPGPLITYFSGKGMAKLRVPMVIVPGHLDQEAINAVTRMRN